MNAPFVPIAEPMYRAISPARIGAMVLRHFYLMRSSWPRLLELIYWPLVQMLMWGFLQTWLLERALEHDKPTLLLQLASWSSSGETRLSVQG